MYPKLIPFLLLACLSTFYACTKHENSQAPVPSDLMSEAKSYFESKVVTGRDIGDDIPKPESADKLPFIKNADWSKAFTQDLAFGKTVVVPLLIPNIYVSSDKGKTKQLLQNNAFLIIYKSENRFKAEVLYKYPTAYSYGGKFTGDIVVQRWDGTITKSFRYINGRGKQITTHHIDINMPQTENSVECVTNDYYYCTYVGTEENCSYNGSTTKCYLNEDGVGGGGDGGGYPETGGGSSTPVGGYSYYSLREIQNNLTNPCFISALNSVSSGTLQSQVSDILRNIFNQSDRLNARFYEEPMADTIDGITTASFTLTDGKTTTNMNITLNSKLITKFNSSKEYIVATILHEVIHAYLLAKKVNPLVDHNEMGLFYIDKMASGIKTVFPTISDDNAKALAWGGVHESYAWKQLVRTSPTAAQKIIEINKNYRTSVSGTKCN
nr:hypothetical protein [uncultured Chitinophaga sp.]